MGEEKQAFLTPARMRALKKTAKAFFQHVGPELTEVIWPEEDTVVNAAPPKEIAKQGAPPPSS